MDKRSRIALPGQRACGTQSEYRHHSRKSPGHIEIYQSSVQFRNRRVVLPAHADIQREGGPHTPIVGDVRIVAGGAEVFIRISKSDGTGIRNAQQETREVGSGGLSGKGERATRLLLSQ